MSRKPRSNKSLRRPNPYVKPRERVLIVCEGGKTEPSYFYLIKRRWQLTSVEIEGKKCGSAPISVVNYALEKKRNAKCFRFPYIYIWCVIDVEIPAHLSLDQAVMLANRNSIKVALSNPCFEYWYILHFEKKAPYFNSNDEVIKMLRQYFPEYKKGEIGILEALQSRLNDASIHAKRVIQEKMYDDDLKHCNPSTHVYRVIEDLERTFKFKT